MAGAMRQSLAATFAGRAAAKRRDSRMMVWRHRGAASKRKDEP